MISSAELQYEYNKLYDLLRNYLWPIEVIENISDLEVACYTAFPDLLKVRTAFDKLTKEVRDLQEDEELQAQLKRFRELLDSSSDLYMKINSVMEVVSHEDIES